jgi:hypothetical protein
MHRPLRRIAHAVAIAALAVCAAAPAAEEPAPAAEPDNAPSAEAMSLDLFLVRPLSLVGTVLGVGVFIIGTPFHLLSWNFRDPARRLIVEPAKYTFTRELGDLD